MADDCRNVFLREIVQAIGSWIISLRKGGNIMHILELGTLLHSSSLTPDTLRITGRRQHAIGLSAPRVLAP